MIWLHRGLALGMLLFGGTLTAVATWAGGNALGADTTWQKGVSVRNDSIRSGRVYVGGGLRGGK